MKRVLLILVIVFVSVITACKPECDTENITEKPVLWELTPENKIVWDEKKFKSPINYSEDDNGHRLIIDGKQKVCLELDKNNNIKWIFFDDHAGFVQKTPEGNYLILSLKIPAEFYEVDSSGNVLWEFKDGENITFVRKLNNGHYMYIEHNANIIREIDQNRNIVWESRNNIFLQPFHFQVLDNGNLLVTDFDHHRIVEIDRNSNILWRSTLPLNHPIRALKLQNGNYAISERDDKRFLVIEKDSSIVFERRNIIASNISLLHNGNIGLVGTVFTEQK